VGDARDQGTWRLSELVDDTTSPERQREIIAAKAAQRDSEIILWATDLDVSASKYPPTERPELARWLKQPEAYDEVIFWRLDRFVRKPSDLTDMIRWAEANGKGLSGCNDTPHATRTTEVACASTTGQDGRGRGRAS
jgi:site-specific DNA recombinase